jgi:hypothetical protein
MPKYQLVLKNLKTISLNDASERQIGHFGERSEPLPFSPKAPL